MYGTAIGQSVRNGLFHFEWNDGKAREGSPEIPNNGLTGFAEIFMTVMPR